MFRRSAFAVLLLIALPLCADKKKGAPLVRLPDQVAEVPDPLLTSPAQKCANWSWAAGLEALLRAQDVPLNQNYWVLKVNLGEVCDDRFLSPEALARSIEGDYTLDDGRKLHLQATVINAAPTIPDQVIAPLRHGHPTLLFWNGRAFLLYGVVFDEYIYPNGQRLFQIRELKLLDPLAPDAQRKVSFVNGKDDPALIDGVLLVDATFIRPQPWLRPPSSP